MDVLSPLHCSSCRLPYRSPVTLPCGHSYCNSPCVDELFRTGHDRHCPLCQEPIKVPRSELRVSKALAAIVSLHTGQPEGNSSPPSLSFQYPHKPDSRSHSSNSLCIFCGNGVYLNSVCGVCGMSREEKQVIDGNKTTNSMAVGANNPNPLGSLISDDIPLQPIINDFPNSLPGRLGTSSVGLSSGLGASSLGLDYSPLTNLSSMHLLSPGSAAQSVGLNSSVPVMSSLGLEKIPNSTNSLHDPTSSLSINVTNNSSFLNQPMNNPWKNIQIPITTIPSLPPNSSISISLSLSIDTSTPKSSSLGLSEVGFDHNISMNTTPLRPATHLPQFDQPSNPPGFPPSQTTALPPNQQTNALQQEELIISTPKEPPTVAPPKSSTHYSGNNNNNMAPSWSEITKRDKDTRGTSDSSTFGSKKGPWDKSIVAAPKRASYETADAMSDSGSSDDSDSTDESIYLGPSKFNPKRTRFTGYVHATVANKKPHGYIYVTKQDSEELWNAVKVDCYSTMRRDRHGKEAAVVTFQAVDVESSTGESLSERYEKNNEIDTLKDLRVSFEVRFSVKHSRYVALRVRVIQ